MACKVFLDCFYNSIEKKQPSSRVEKIYVKTSFNIPLTIHFLGPNSGDNWIN